MRKYTDSADRELALIDRYRLTIELLVMILLENTGVCVECGKSYKNDFKCDNCKS